MCVPFLPLRVSPHGLGGLHEHAAVVEVRHVQYPRALLEIELVVCEWVSVCVCARDDGERTCVRVCVCVRVSGWVLCGRFFLFGVSMSMPQ